MRENSTGVKTGSVRSHDSTSGSHLGLKGSNGAFELGRVAALEVTHKGTVLEEEEGGQSVDLVVGSELLSINSVDLDELDVVELTRELGNDRSDLLAVSAPRSPEVDDSNTRLGDGLQLSSGGDLIHSSSGGGLTTLVGSSEVGLGLSRISLHGKVSRLPVGRADLAVNLDELEGLDQANDLIDVTADRKIIAGDLTEVSARINDEESAQRNTVR